MINLDNLTYHVNILLDTGALQSNYVNKKTAEWLLQHNARSLESNTRVCSAFNQCINITKSFIINLSFLVVDKKRKVIDNKMLVNNQIVNYTFDKQRKNYCNVIKSNNNVLLLDKHILNKESPILTNSKRSIDELHGRDYDRQSSEGRQLSSIIYFVMIGTSVH